MTTEEAKEILEADNKKRSEECLQAVNKVLKDFNCSIVVQPTITINGNPQIIEIKPN